MSFLNSIGSVLQNPLALSAIGATTLNPAMIASTAGIFGDTFDLANQFYWNNKNYEQQESTQNWNKRLQYAMFSREDNSIQRRVADLKAAGLSPVLAAGSGAGSGAVVNVGTPQRNIETSLGDKVMNLISMLKGTADISKTYADNKLVEMQTAKIPFEIANMQKMFEEMNANIDKINADRYRSLTEADRTKAETDFTKIKSEREKFARDIDISTNQQGDSFLGDFYRDLFGHPSGKNYRQSDDVINEIRNTPKIRRIRRN